MGCVRRNSAVCSFSSLASADTPTIAAKKAPPSPSTFPHSTPKYPINSPKFSLSIPNASEKAPIFAIISLMLSISEDISGYIITVTESIKAIIADHITSESLFLFSS